MEGRSPPWKAVPNRRVKGEIKQEATGSSQEKPPFDDSEPPPLEDVSEPYSKASSPRLSSPISDDLEKGVSPRSSNSRKGNSSLSSSERGLSPPSYKQTARSPSSSVEKGHSPSTHADELLSPASRPHNQLGEQRPQSPSSSLEEVQSRSTHADEVLSPALRTDNQQGEQLHSNFISVQNEPSSAHAGANNFDHKQSKTGIASSTSASTTQKADIKSSLRTSIPALRQSVAAGVKHVSFKSSSFSSRSSPAIYGSKPWWKTTTHVMKIVEVTLRIGGAVLALIAFLVMCATSEWRQGAGSTFKMSFKDYQAYNYLVALNVISFVYSCWQAVAVFHSRVGDVLNTPRENMLFTYICDQILAFLLFSASTAAATAAQLSRHGLHNIWPPACATWSLWHFCAQADAAVAMSFLSSFFVISSSVFSGYKVSHSLSE